MFKAKVYGSFAVKFRAFGVDWGFIKKSVSLVDAVPISIPFALPTTLPIAFNKFGVQLDIFVVKA